MITQADLSEFKTIMLADYSYRFQNDAEALKLAEDYLITLEAVLAMPRKNLTKVVAEAHNGD